MNTATPGTQSERAIAIWLLLVCAMIYGMVVLGGVTRLTGSGLSMVRWNPIFGILPPLSQARWQTVFDQYRQSPEYRKINYGMDLAGFKRIYWFEYAHRLLGRSIGLVFLLPFLYFLWRRRIRRALVPRLVLMFVLGGLQGLLGWYMVKSGLVDRPHVSQYRLTAHLGAATLIYAYILWVALGLLFPPRGEGTQGRARMPLLLAGLVFGTMLSGGFVAGLKAGLAFNTFPLMNGRLVPDGYLLLQPAWHNFFENIATVQFDHRLLALVTLAAILTWWWRARRTPPAGRGRWALHLLPLVALAQASLGIATLLLRVPIPLASVHQANALLLLTVSLYLAHARRHDPAPVAATVPAARGRPGPERLSPGP